MKFFSFGLTITSSWGNGHATPYRAIVRALHRLGHHIHFFEQDAPYYSSRRDFQSCDYCHITTYPDWDSVRGEAMAAAADADVLITGSFLPEGRQINDELLQLSRPLHVYYDLDTPVTLRRMKEDDGVEYLLREQLAAFDLVL